MKFKEGDKVFVARWAYEISYIPSAKIRKVYETTQRYRIDRTEDMGFVSCMAQEGDLFLTYEEAYNSILSIFNARIKQLEIARDKFIQNEKNKTRGIQ